MIVYCKCPCQHLVMDHCNALSIVIGKDGKCTDQEDIFVTPGTPPGQFIQYNEEPKSKKKGSAKLAKEEN